MSIIKVNKIKRPWMKVCLNKLIVFLVTYLIIFPGIALAENKLEVDVPINCNSISNSWADCYFYLDNESKAKTITATLGGVSANITNISGYPSKSQKTAALVLVDTSDPSRISTVQNNISTANQWVANKKVYQSIAVALFDHDLRLIADFNGKQYPDVAKSQGQATEFYRSILNGIKLLDKQNASRKVLIVFSDGKVEDKAYTNEDVVKEAKAADVKILALGFPERMSETPFLQNLEVLATKTGGRYFSAEEKTGILPDDVLKSPLSFVENGASFSVSTSQAYGNTPLAVSIILNDGVKVNASTNLSVPDNRSFFKKSITFIKSNYIWVLVLVIVAFSMLFFVLNRRKKLKNLKEIDVVYGYLNEMDGMCTKHEILKKAIRIGRSPQNDIVLSNDSISSHHAEIILQRNGVFSITDLSSSNGVFVNELKISQSELKHRDIVELGEVRLRFMDTKTI